MDTGVIQVKKDGEALESQARTGFFGAQTKWLRIMGLFLWGLKFVALCGIVIIAFHLEHSPVKNPHMNFLVLIFLLVSSILLLALLIFEFYRSFLLLLLCKDSTFTKETVSFFAVGGCLAILSVLHKLNLAPIVVGSVAAVYFLGERNAYKCSYPWIALGCFLSGLFTQVVPWPDMMRVMLVLFGVGVSATLQGAWIIFRNLPGHRLIASSEIDNSGKVQMPDTLEEMQIRDPDLSWDRVRSWFGKSRKASI